MENAIQEENQIAKVQRKLKLAKVFKKKRFWIILIIAIIIGAVLLKSNNGQQPEYVTDVVKRGKLVQTVSATGKVESASESDLNFKIAGKLISSNVKVGDEVTKGQLLARLESSQAQSQVASTRAQLLEAEADLASVIAGSSDEDVAIANAKVNQAQADLDSKKAVWDNLALENDQNLLSYKEQSLDKVAESIFNIEEAIEDIDEIINGSDESALKIYNSSYSLALNDYNNAVSLLNNLVDAANDYSVNNSIDELVSLLNQADLALDQADDMLSSTYNLLSVADPVSSLTQTEIDAHKITVNADQSNISSAISAVQTAKSNLQIKSVEYDNSVQEAELDAEKAQSALVVAQAELNSVLAGPRSFEISLQQARVDIARAKLQSALADLNEYCLFAPIDGIITSVDYKIGEYVSSVNSAVSILSKSNLEIEVDVPESDIAKVKVGDIAEITLDAFGEEKFFNSHISFINPAETIINDVVYYKVKLTFDEKDEGIKSGMTANVLITTASKDNVLYIPARAVIENDIRYVRVFKNDEIVEEEVATGLRGDNGLIEVLSGLEEGQEIITYIKNGK